MGAVLAADELPAVLVREGQGPFVVVCEHASNVLPRSLGTLGLAESDCWRHIAWDPGAVAMAEAIADAHDSDLVVQRYSRLVVDCNRAPSLPDAIPERSEDTVIPGNADLNAAARVGRIEAVWTPFHAALERLIARRLAARMPTALVTIHTFTPVYRGLHRPWHAGVISTGERSFADAVLSALRRDKSLVVGDNEPYSPKDNVDYTIRRHGADRGLPNVMIEVRNDLVASASGQREWADRLSSALGNFDVEARAA